MMWSNVHYFRFKYIFWGCFFLNLENKSQVLSYKASELQSAKVFNRQ